MDIPGCLWDIPGCPWVSVDIPGCLWDIPGCPWVDVPKPCTTIPAAKEFFPSREDPSTESSSHTLYTDRKEGLKEETETELHLLIGKRQRLSPILEVPQALLEP